MTAEEHKQKMLQDIEAGQKHVSAGVDAGRDMTAARRELGALIERAHKLGYYPEEV